MILSFFCCTFWFTISIFRVKENNRQKECGRGVLMVTFKAKEMTEGGGTD